MRVLQHYHPQGSHIFRSLVEAAKLFSVKLKDIDLLTIVGANFLPSYSRTSDFIVHLTPPLNSAKTHTIPNHLFSYEQYLKSSFVNPHFDESIFSPDESLMFVNSVNDSLYRGLTPAINTNRLYQEYNGKYFTMCHGYRRRYAIELFHYYLELIDSQKPDLVTLSHGNYDYYITLYLAARKRGIPVLLVHGGFNRSCLILNKGPLTDHSPSSEKIRIFNALLRPSTDSSSLKADILTYISNRPDACAGVEAHKNSSLQLFSTSYRTSIANSGRLYYILMMPILGEVCHQDLFYNINYSSKLNWIESIFCTLANNPHPLIVRHHPEVDFYNEKSISFQFLEFLSHKYSISVRHIYGNNELSTFFRSVVNERQSFIPLSFGSTISSELATISLPSITANGCLATLLPNATIFQDHVDFYDPRPHLCANTTKLRESSTSTDDLKMLLTWINLTGKYYSVDRPYRLRADLHLFFGRGQLMPSQDIKYTLYDYYENLNLLCLEIGDCLHLYTN